MEYKYSLILLVTMLTIVPWGLAFIIQKAENLNRSEALHFKTTSLIVVLFGLSPGKEFVYVGPGIIQIWSIVYLVVCLIAASLWGGNGVIKATLYVYSGGIVLLAALRWIISIVLKQK